MTDTIAKADTLTQKQHEEFMLQAIALAHKTSIEERAGGPFGTVIVKDGKVVGMGSNHVLAHSDPTAHGEVMAIRDACEKLGTHDLSGCELYTTGQCCPMCYGAASWARVDRIYYAATVDDTTKYGGFDDAKFFAEMMLPPGERPLKEVQICHEEMLEVWKEFHDMPNRPHY